MRSKPTDRARKSTYKTICLRVTRLRLSFDTKHKAVGATVGPCLVGNGKIKTGNRSHSALIPRDSRVPRSLGNGLPPP